MPEPEPAARALLRDVERLRSAVIQEGAARYERWSPAILREGASERFLNLAHYLALRARDLTSLQDRLAPLGLSTLGRSESHVVPTLDAVIASLRAICRETPVEHPSPGEFWEGEQRLAAECDAVFGPRPPGRRTRIMVTLPAEAADEPDYVASLIQAGMDMARINCAHDDVDTWHRMIEHVRAAEARLERRCLVAMDLCGPRARIVAVAADPEHRVMPGDTLVLTADAPGARADQVVQFQCGIPEVVDQLSEGAEVWIDGGRLGTTVVGRQDGGLVLRVHHVRPSGRRLGVGKGLNFPGSRLDLTPLTPEDIAALDFVAPNADLIGYSFVQQPSDVDALFAQLIARGRPPETARLILKVETPTAIQQLPRLIIAASGRCPTAVMIARGDLAVEVGFGRMAEMQEELLWLCEAAHTPVIWATDVLQNLAAKGVWTRAEVTDAAMAERADCVMLNKGPFIVEAVRALDDVIRRMEGHQSRKRPRLRQLKAWL